MCCDDDDDGDDDGDGGGDDDDDDDDILGQCRIDSIVYEIPHHTQAIIRYEHHHHHHPMHCFIVCLQERLTKKERRAMKSSGKVGKVANNRVKALIDVVQLKRYYQYLT